VESEKIDLREVKRKMIIIREWGEQEGGLGTG
jgi:hypothetical protein